MLIVRRFQSKKRRTFKPKNVRYLTEYLHFICRVPEKCIYFDSRVNYLHNREVENLNIYEIRKQTWELSQITMLTSTKAKEMVHKYEVFYYLNVFGLRVKQYC